MKTENALLIFDPHLDVAWIRRILAKEQGAFSHLLLGGDYFDAKSARAGTTAEMCELLFDLSREYGSQLTLLWGNHDIQYLEALPAMRLHRNPRNLRYKIPGDYTNSQAKKISKLLSKELIQRGQLFEFINGYLISHAGLATEFWPEADNSESALQILQENCDEALLKLPYADSELLRAGLCRGGTQATGGLTWLDFDAEFEDRLELPQIFGHTSCRNEDIQARARKKGRSWCLDGAQSIYGLLDESGELSIRSA